jgi:cytoskeletal protein CcmA (bactofilin family)
MFGRKDSIKEFEQMRQALKPAERFAAPVQAPVQETSTTTSRDGIGNSNPISQQPGNATPANTIDEKGKMQATDNCSTVLSNGTAWQGNLKTQGSVRVEGQLSGEIDATDTVYVAEGAQVDAKIRATLVVIAGHFQGEVNCRERLEVMPTGQVKAQLTTKSLVVHEGAFIEGQIHMSEPKQSAAPGQGLSGNRVNQPVQKVPEKDGKPLPASSATV